MIYRATLAGSLIFALFSLFSTQGSNQGVAEELGPDTDIVTTELEQLDLVVKARPILPEITSRDPLRLAIHFEKNTGPIDHSDQALGQQLFDRSGTLATMDIAIKAPGGGWELFKPQAEEGAAPRQSSLMSDGTLLLELAPASVKSLRIGGQEEFAMPWKWAGELEPGEYQIAMRGTLKLSTRERTVRQRGKPEEKLPATTTDVAFRTKPISVVVARADMRNQTLEELAAAAVDVVKEQAEVKTEKLEVQSVESIPIADQDGNRVIRVRANIPEPKPEVDPGGRIIIAPRIAGGTGYWQYEVAMSPEGKPATVARWRKGFCVAHGTKISTPEGDVAVENLYAGQQVWAFDADSGNVVTANVLAVLSSHIDETVLLNDTLRLSPDHPVFVRTDSKDVWKRAAEVREGDVLLLRSLRPVKVESVEVVGGRVDVFDVAVDGPHNFFAADMLVHNKSIAWTPQAFVPWYALWNRAPIK